MQYAHGGGMKRNSPPLSCPSAPGNYSYMVINRQKSRQAKCVCCCWQHTIELAQVPS